MPQPGKPLRHTVRWPADDDRSTSCFMLGGRRVKTALLAFLSLTALSLPTCGLTITNVNDQYLYDKNKAAVHSYRLRIRDWRGRYVHGLKQDDFQVLLGGRDMGSEATTGIANVSVAELHIVLDVSHSIYAAKAIDQLVKSVHSFIKDSDEALGTLNVYLYTFSSAYGVYSPTTDGERPTRRNECGEATAFNPTEILTGNMIEEIVKLETLNANRNSQYTNLYGAVFFAGRCARRESMINESIAPSIVMVFTDGMDNIGEHSLEDIKAAKSRGELPTMVSVGLGDVDKDALTDIASDGMFYYAQNPQMLQQAFQQLARNIAYMWQFDFYPPKGKEGEPVVLRLDPADYWGTEIQLPGAEPSVVRCGERCIDEGLVPDLCNAACTSTSVRQCILGAVSGGDVIECACGRVAEQEMTFSSGWSGLCKDVVYWNEEHCVKACSAIGLNIQICHGGCEGSLARRCMANQAKSPSGMRECACGYIHEQFREGHKAYWQRLEEMCRAGR